MTDFSIEDDEADDDPVLDTEGDCLNPSPYLNMTRYHFQLHRMRRMKNQS